MESENKLDDQIEAQMIHEIGKKDEVVVEKENGLVKKVWWQRWWVLVMLLLTFVLTGCGWWWWQLREYKKTKTMNSVPLVVENKANNSINTRESVASESGVIVNEEEEKIDGNKLKLSKSSLNNFPPQSSTMKVQDKTEVVDSYDKIKEKGGCPGMCGYFVEDLSRIDEQFKLLESVNHSGNCVLSNELTQKIKEKFVLFANGIEKRDEVKGVRLTGLGGCGVRYVASDGYDADLGNYNYKVGAVIGNKLIRLEWQVYPRSMFPEVDELYRGIGYGDGRCDSGCFERMMKYIEEIDWNHQLEASIIQKYDELVEKLVLEVE